MEPLLEDGASSRRLSPGMQMCSHRSSEQGCNDQRVEKKRPMSTKMEGIWFFLKKDKADIVTVFQEGKGGCRVEE